MKEGDKVWGFIAGEIHSAIIDYIPNNHDYAVVIWDWRKNLKGSGRIRDHWPKAWLFPSREALCEHYRKIFEK